MHACENLSLGYMHPIILFDYRPCIPLVLLDTVKLFSKVTVPISLPLAVFDISHSLDIVSIYTFLPVSWLWNYILLWIYLITGETEHLFACLLANMTSSVNTSFRLLAHFSCFVRALNFINCVANLFSHSGLCVCGCVCGCVRARARAFAVLIYRSFKFYAGKFQCFPLVFSPHLSDLRHGEQFTFYNFSESSTFHI